MLVFVPLEKLNVFLNIQKKMAKAGNLDAIILGLISLTAYNTFKKEAYKKPPPPSKPATAVAPKQSFTIF